MSSDQHSSLISDLNTEELIVKARYLLPVEPKEETLRTIQQKLSMTLIQSGYQQTDVDLDIFGPAQRTMDFRRVHVPSGEPSFAGKVKSYLGFDAQADNSAPNEREFLDGLERVRDDLPFRLVFYFKTVEEDGTEGYDVLIESTPMLLQKARQLDLNSEYGYNVKDVVEENKREMNRVMGRFGVDPFIGPYTDADLIEPQLSEPTIQALEQHEYGRAALQYLGEGDHCLQKNLLHASLSCYIHAIEWVILSYKVVQEETDLVEEQRAEDKHFTFHHLVAKIRNGTPASQKTISKLENMNSAERRWAAHHKTGEVERAEVENVRSTLFRLIDELT